MQQATGANTDYDRRAMFSFSFPTFAARYPLDWAIGAPVVLLDFLRRPATTRKALRADFDRAVRRDAHEQGFSVLELAHNDWLDLILMGPRTTIAVAGPACRSADLAFEVMHEGSFDAVWFMGRGPSGDRLVKLSRSDWRG